MPDIRLLDCMTLREAHQVAEDAGMYLIHDGREVKVSPIIPPGWRRVLIKLKTKASANDTAAAARVSA